MSGAEVDIEIWWGKDHLEDLAVDGSYYNESQRNRLQGTLTGLIWLRVGTDGGLL
jgi:hypothetical protein